MGILKPEKTALVTGSSRGIGAAIAARLAQDGFLVVVNYAKGEDAAQEVVERIEAAGGQAVSVRADLTKDDELVHLFERTAGLGAPLQVVVHNAGIQLLGSHAEMSGEDLDRLIAANLRATFSVVSQAARRVVEGGRIIALSSGTSVVLPPRYGVYAATKAATEILIGVLGKELRGRNITANAVSPGPVATDLYLKGKSASDLEAAASRSPLGRIGKPDDIAGVVAFLASPDGQWINGQTLLANGGFA